MVTAETKDEVTQAAWTHGWTLDGVDIVELQPPEGDTDANEQYTVFHPSEVQLDEATKVLLEAVDRVKPTRVVIDSITGLRLLAQTPVRYRQQVLLLKRAFGQYGTTGLLLDDMAEQTRDLQLRSVVHGILSLYRVTPRYGATRRQSSRWPSFAESNSAAGTMTFPSGQRGLPSTLGSSHPRITIHMPRR